MRPASDFIYIQLSNSRSWNKLTRFLKDVKPCPAFSNFNKQKRQRNAFIYRSFPEYER